jgi:hypothetical protein
MADLRRTLQAIATAVPPGVIVPAYVLEARRRQRNQERQRITILHTAVQEPRPLTPVIGTQEDQHVRPI